MPPASSSAPTFEFDAPLRPTASAADGGADYECVIAPGAREGAFYGWMMVLITTVVIVASAPGQTYGFAYFNPWLRRSLSLSQTELSTTYLLATLLAAVPLSYLGGWVDALGLKRSMLAAVAAMAAACLAAAAVQSVPMLFAVCFAMRLIGPGVMSLLANNTLAAWFDRRLGAATSALQFGNAAAIALAPVCFLALIAAVGWREAYAVQGLVLAVGVLPLVWWAYREHPQEIGQVRDGAIATEQIGRRQLRIVAAMQVLEDELSFDLASAVRTRTFWILITANCMWSMIGTGLVFHLDSLLASRGMSAAQAAWATPVMAICMAGVQLAGGWIADRAAPGRLLTTALILVATACMALALGRGIELVAAYGIYGVAQGIMSLVTTTVWARFYGRKHLGRIRGTALTAGISGSAVGPLVMGACADACGGFGPSMWAFAAGALLVSLICPLATRPEVAAAPPLEFILPNAA
jgi:MFS family permease